jgi:hypothetical protein
VGSRVRRSGRSCGMDLEGWWMAGKAILEAAGGQERRARRKEILGDATSQAIPVRIRLYAQR